MNRRSITMILLITVATFAVTGCKKEKPKEEEKEQETEGQNPKLLNKILYAGGTINLPLHRQFYTVNSDGTNEKQLTSFPNPEYLQIHGMSWSPDGTKIIFVSNESGPSIYEIYIMNADGTGATRLTNSPNRLKASPSFSPDGKTILFSTSPQDRLYAIQLFTMNIDGTGEKQLTFFENHGIFNFTSAGAWSPDGKKIVFMSNKDAKKDNYEEYQFYVMNSDGTDATILKTKAKVKNFPSYSPDGNKILFNGNVENKVGQNRLFTINIDGTGEKQITNDQLIVNSPRWSPDGKKIIFGGYTHMEDYMLYTINADGTGMIKLNTKTPATGDVVWR